MQATLNYRLIKKIQDERFDVDHINEYDLYIHVGPRDMQVGVVDSRENKMLLLEDFVFPSLTSQDNLLQVLEQLFDDHSLLTAAFWKKVKYEKVFVFALCRRFCFRILRTGEENHPKEWCCDHMGKEIP